MFLGKTISNRWIIAARPGGILKETFFEWGRIFLVRTGESGKLIMNEKNTIEVLIKNGI